MDTAKQAPVSAQSRLAHRPLRVLGVDDCPGDRVLLAVLLEDWGLQASIASDGAEAVRLAKQFQFDLVLMDLSMPVPDGVAATRQIRAFEAREPSRRAVPILAHTTMAVAPDSQLLVRVGLNGVLPKPTSPFSLESCIKRWCPQAVQHGPEWRG
ncbi:MAG: response regulator [Burkholderiales bacterium]|nr:response regulator [Burkholderiales bacterium]